MKIEKMSAKRKARERKLWRKILVVSLIPMVLSMVFAWYGVFLVCFIAFILFYLVYDRFAPDKDYGPTPWWYFGL